MFTHVLNKEDKECVKEYEKKIDELRMEELKPPIGMQKL